MHNLDWLPGYVRDEIEALVHVEQRRAAEFRAGGYEISKRHRAHPAASVRLEPST